MPVGACPFAVNNVSDHSDLQKLLQHCLVWPLGLVRNQSFNVVIHHGRWAQLPGLVVKPHGLLSLKVTAKCRSTMGNEMATSHRMKVEATTKAGEV